MNCCVRTAAASAVTFLVPRAPRMARRCESLSPISWPLASMTCSDALQHASKSSLPILCGVYITMCIPLVAKEHKPEHGKSQSMARTLWLSDPCMGQQPTAPRVCHSYPSPHSAYHPALAEQLLCHLRVESLTLMAALQGCWPIHAALDALTRGPGLL
jgi:hypothetical protein